MTKVKMTDAKRRPVAEATAPGKLFLSGEYAVLEGAPALLVPVAQRAKASLWPRAEGEASIQLLGLEPLDLPLSSLDQAPLVKAVIEELRAAGKGGQALDGFLDGQLKLQVDTTPFYLGLQKLGLGSSAAATVSVLSCFCPGLSPETALPLARQAHLRFQGGKGSGADVALAVHDKPIQFRDGSVKAVSLPAKLHLLFMWTGEEASSTDLLGQLTRFQKAQPSAYHQAMEALSMAAKEVVQASGGSAENFIQAVQRYDDLLLAFSSASGLDFYSKPHLALRKAVKSAACVYKLSGAGGGDFGLALAASPDPLVALQETLDQAGILYFLHTQHPPE